MIAGVVLAAGSGSRFGEGAKQLAELDGIPLLEHALRAIEAVPAIDRVIVVLGARADEILAGVDFGAAEPVICAHWDEGRSASLRRGIQAVAHEADAAVLMLGDTPRITSQVIGRFSEIAREHGPHARARAVYDGRPGHPVVLGSAYFEQIDGLSGDVGAREVLKEIGAVAIECGQLCSDGDVDTPEALDEMRR